jgi:hypothetical protein
METMLSIGRADLLDAPARSAATMFKPFLSPSLPALLEEVIPLGIFKNQLKLTKEQFRKKLNCWIFRTIKNKIK